MPRIQKRLAYLILFTVATLIMAYLNDPAAFNAWYEANQSIITAIATITSVVMILYIAVYSAEKR